MAIWQRLRARLQKTMADAGMGKEYKDVFEVEGVPAFREFYNLQIFPAKYVYRGFYNAWHTVYSPTIADYRATRTLFRMGMAKAVCAELASLIWAEGADIHISTGGKDDTLERFVLDVLRANAFGEKMQELIEQAAALGGAAVKEYIKVKHDDEGKPVEGTERIMIDYCMADQFVPTAWDNAQVSEAVFVSRKAKDGMYWTRLEWHSWNGDTYVIKNDMYGTKQARQNGQDQDILGYWYPLSACEQFLEPVTEINGLSKSLFAYFRTPFANNIDDNSPLGISVYGNAFDTLHALDICYDSFVREFRLGKKRIIVPAAAVRTVVDPETGEMRRYFDANDEAFEALATDDPDKLKVQDNSAELRVEEHIAAINALLSVLCLQVGFSAATFSFDMQNGLKTATEVISENSKTYKTIGTFQTQIKAAIEKMVINIIELGVLYDMEFEGRKIADLAKGYEVSVMMEDAVLEDSSTRINRAITLISNGLLSKKSAMTDPKYGIGMTEDEADAELQRIADEGQISATAFDMFQTGTLE